LFQVAEGILRKLRIRFCAKFKEDLWLAKKQMAGENPPAI